MPKNQTEQLNPTQPTKAVAPEATPDLGLSDADHAITEITEILERYRRQFDFLLFNRYDDENDELIQKGPPVVVRQQELRIQDLIQDQIDTLKEVLSKRRTNVLTAILHGAEVEPGDFMVEITEKITSSGRFKTLRVRQEP